jgi:hypothetical protein
VGLSTYGYLYKPSTLYMLLIFAIWDRSVTHRHWPLGQMEMEHLHSYTHTFIFTWEESMVTVKDVCAIFLLPYLGECGVFENPIWLCSRRKRLLRNISREARIEGLPAKFSAWIKTFSREEYPIVQMLAFLAY